MAAIPNTVYSQFRHHSSKRSKSDPEEYEIPITELPNELTSAIDIGTASDIVESLGQCDSQIFSGWRHFPSIYDEDVIMAMEKISSKAAEVLENSSDSSVVLSGCGTSGRLAFILARTFSQIAKRQQFSARYDYLIAGGDMALFTSLEAPEDDFNKGQEDLIQITRGKKRVLYIGITCGLSAPYVAGQLDYCMSDPTVFTPVLLGFNPLHQARKNVIEGWHKSFFDVASALKDHPGSIIITPVIGPEPITGSSRMKGGSATKIILESILLKAHDQAADQKSMSSVSLQQILMRYESVHKKTYLVSTDIAKAVEIAARSLRCNRHVYYVGWDSLGLLGLLDASECVPTFGADFNDIRGFVNNGFYALKTKQRELFIDGSKKINISLQDFEDVFLPELSSHDTVVVILPDKDKFCHVMEVLKLISKQEACMVGLLCEDNVDRKFKDIFHCLVHVKPPLLPEQVFPRTTPTLDTESLTECLQHCFKEIAIKWILNAISTGAHILKGNVLGNYMINLKVSNNKMFHRAVSIVFTFAQVGKEKALSSVLQAIYQGDISEHVAHGKVSEHVKRGSVVERVIPVAILVASDKFNVESAVEILKTKTITLVLKDMGLLKNL